MSGINIIIPACGNGRRFKEKGYTNHKPMIPIFNKPMILHVLDGLTLKTEDRVFLIVNFHDDTLEENLLHHFSFNTPTSWRCPFTGTEGHLGGNEWIQQVSFIRIDQQTGGTAETILLGLKQIMRGKTDNARCLIMDCDAFYTDNIVQKYRDVPEPLNAVFYTKNTDKNPVYSYIRFTDKQITEIAEKRKISDNANTGVYCFAEMKELKRFCDRVVSQGLTDGGEFYMSCVIREMIREGHLFRPLCLENNRVFNVGTPEQLDMYLERTHLFSFDLDGTLVLTDKIYYDVWKNILTDYGMELTPFFYAKYIQGNADSVAVSGLFPQGGEELVWTISRRKDALFIENLEKIEVIEGALSFLCKVRMAGHKIAVVTNCNRGIAEHILRYTGIADYTDLLVIGSECDKPKPHEHPYLFALNHFGTTCDKNIIFEDSKTGIQSGIKIHPKCIVGIETIYTKQELLDLHVNRTIQNYLEANVHDFTDVVDIDNYHKQHLLVLDRTIKQSLPHLSIDNIQWDAHELKGGFISSVLALKITTVEEKEHDCVLKLSNDCPNSSLQKMANELDLYEREYYFYNSISSFVPVKIPPYYGIIHDDQENHLGVLMGNLYKVGMKMNVDLNETSIETPLLVIDRLAKLHATFWGTDLEKRFPYLKKNNDSLFCPKWGDFIRSKWTTFKEKWRIIIDPIQMEKADEMMGRFDEIQEELSRGPHLTLCHGDVKSPNMFFSQDDNEPYFIDWQYVCIGKGVQDLVFFMIESFNVETRGSLKPLFKQQYYTKLQDYGVQNYSLEEYNRDFENAIYYFPFFVAVWFGTLDTDELLDKEFPASFIKRLFHFWSV